MEVSGSYFLHQGNNPQYSVEGWVDLRVSLDTTETRNISAAMRNQIPVSWLSSLASSLYQLCYPKYQLGTFALYLHSPYIFMAWCLIRNRDNFSLPLYSFWTAELEHTSLSKQTFISDGSKPRSQIPTAIKMFVLHRVITMIPLKLISSYIIRNIYCYNWV